MLLQIGLVTLVGDGLDYAKHRLVHTVPWLWRVHALHHGVSRFHVFKAGRLHFIEVLMRFALVFSPLAIAGAPPEIILWYAAFIPIFGIVGHSNVDVRTPSVVHRLLMTPQVHRLHHSIERTTSDTNYANIFPIWDVLFGTFSHPDTHSVDQVGVIDDPIPSGFVGQFLSPFTWGRLVKET